VSGTLVSIRDLAVAFDGAPALRGIDLDIRPGEAVGLVGESGCGKSVTWLAALGLLPSHTTITGSVRFGEREILGAPSAVLDRVRGGRIAMIFQDPVSSLNPVHRLGAQVEEALRLHRGLTGPASRAEARRLFDQVGIPDAARRLNAYPHELSGGQNQRVMIAMALAGQPDLLVADEPTTALDVTIQAQILDLLGSLRRETGMALVLISHDLGVVADTCERVAVMYCGRIIEQAPVARLFANPAHPYTRGLLASIPSLDTRRARLPAIEGTVPMPGRMPSGCRFAPRCSQRLDACVATDPPLAPRGPRHAAACLLPTAAAR
jgi:peptide/nickel transport system ATP-binding protein